MEICKSSSFSKGARVSYSILNCLTSGVAKHQLSKVQGTEWQAVDITMDPVETLAMMDMDSDLSFGEATLYTIFGKLDPTNP